jgi:HlyD family secretion protein
MDIPRPDLAHRRKLRRAIYAGLILAAAAALTLGLSRLKPAAPEVDRASVWMDTVRRGEMVRQVRGLGSLVPEAVRIIPAEVAGRVENREVLPGTAVKPDTVLLDLSNPELTQSALEADWQLRAAVADTVNLKVQLKNQFLSERADAARIAAEYRQAKLQADADQKLLSLGLTSELVAKLSAAKAQELETRNEIERERLAQFAESIKAQEAAQQAKVEQLRALDQLKHTQLGELRVRSGIAGVLQQLNVEVGQQVAPGAVLAKVADPARLKAQLLIPETEAKDLMLAQQASVDTHNGVIPGHVMRIDPAVVNGTVTVDVSLDGALPQGARPDLSVEGTVLIERLKNVLYVGRPVHAEPETTIALFKIVDDGKQAVRVPVKIGRVSVNTVEILDGLKPGDRVILSDMSAWENFDRVRLR